MFQDLDHFNYFNEGFLASNSFPSLPILASKVKPSYGCVSLKPKIPKHITKSNNGKGRIANKSNPK